MWYNLICLDDQNTGALYFQKPPYPVNEFMGKAPFMCWTFVLADRLGNGGAHGGRFAMAEWAKANKWKLQEARFRALSRENDDELHRPGIYAIQNIVNGKKYIGQSVDIADRWKGHKNALASGKHPNKYLQNSVNKYGLQNFKFCVIEFCRRDELNDREQYWIERINPDYNIAKNVYEWWYYRAENE